jgi:hypothetical protein
MFKWIPFGNLSILIPAIVAPPIPKLPMASLQKGHSFIGFSLFHPLS